MAYSDRLMVPGSYNLQIYRPSDYKNVDRINEGGKRGQKSSRTRFWKSKKLPAKARTYIGLD